MAVNAETHRFAGCQEQVMVQHLLVNRTFMPPSLKLKDHSRRGSGTDVRAKGWGRLAKCHLLGFMQVPQSQTHSGSCYHHWAWSTICHGYGRSSWDAIPCCRATGYWNILEKGSHCFQWTVPNSWSHKCPWLFSMGHRTKSKDMNERKGFIGRSVREMGGEINQNALYITDIIYMLHNIII